MKIVIILPTYNERVNIQKLIPILEEKVFPKIKNHDIHILVVDDNSPDGTQEEVRTFMQKWENIELLLGEKEGLGAAYVRGMHYAMDKMKGDAVIEFDSDFQHDPNDIPVLITAMDNGADYVIGSRYVKGGAIPKEWRLHRKIISRLGGLFAQILLWTWSIHDMTSGLKLTKSSFLRKVDLDHLYSKYYAYKLHILHDVMLQKPVVAEVPIIFYERKEGSSKITGKDLFDSFWVVLRLKIRDSKRAIKFLFVGGTGFIVQVTTQEATIHSGISIFFTNILVNFNLVKDVTSVSHSIGAGLGAESAIISNFLLNNFWTFNDARKLKEKSNFFVRAIKFNLASLGSIFIQSIAVLIAEKSFGENILLFSYQLPTRLVVIIPTIILFVIPLNYFIYNVVIWKTQYLRKKTT
ncbi:glycosyltransferase family 2 protein [Patescibacteria group bacterium]|nr:glycosyltransferase family 2 protein [Patescibacteria group bacterium]